MGRHPQKTIFHIPKFSSHGVVNLKMNKMKPRRKVLYGKKINLHYQPFFHLFYSLQFRFNEDLLKEVSFEISISGCVH